MNPGLVEPAHLFPPLIRKFLKAGGWGVVVRESFRVYIPPPTSSPAPCTKTDRLGMRSNGKVSTVPMTGDPAQVSSPTHHPRTHQPVPLGLHLQTLHTTLPTDSALATSPGLTKAHPDFQRALVRLLHLTVPQFAFPQNGMMMPNIQDSSCDKLTSYQATSKYWGVTRCRCSKLTSSEWPSLTPSSIHITSPHTPSLCQRQAYSSQPTTD